LTWEADRVAQVSWIQHKEKRILYMNYSNSKIGDIVRAVAETKEIVKKEPPVSVLGIVDVRESPFNTGVSGALKDLAGSNKPYIKMSVVVGVDGLKQVIYKAVLKFTGRKNLLLKNTLDEAKDFLAGLP
jgi:hypothetical protein